MKSLATALRVLALFQENERDRTVSEISRALDLPKSQVSRILAEFRNHGWLTQDPRTRSYSVGLGAYVVGIRYLSAERLTRVALPVLRAVADRSSFTTTLSILDGIRPLYLFGVESPIYAELGTRMGEHFPMHASAMGKVLAAFSPPDRFQEWIATYGLQSVTSNTICEQTEFKREFTKIRDQGYAASLGERTPGVNGLAAPVFGADGELIAAMGLAYPDSYVGPDRIDYFAAILQDGARQLSERMGLARYPYHGEGGALGRVHRAPALERRTRQ